MLAPRPLTATTRLNHNSPFDLHNPPPLHSYPSSSSSSSSPTLRPLLPNEEYRLVVSAGVSTQWIIYHLPPGKTTTPAMEAVTARRKAWDEKREARERVRERFLACEPAPRREGEVVVEEDATAFVAGCDCDGGFGSGAEETSAPAIASVPGLEADGDDDHDHGDDDDDDDKPDSNVAEPAPAPASVVDDEEISWRMVVQPAEEEDEMDESEGLWMKSSRSFL